MNSTKEKLHEASYSFHLQQAIEHVRTQPKITPTRIFAVLFPLWQVEATEIREQGLPYNFIEKYIERGITEAALDSPQALAAFYGLDIETVKDTLAALDDIGHIVRMSGPLRLTPLGIRSVLEGKKFIQQEARCTLYFDGFYSKPLPGAYYHNTQILTQQEAADLVQNRDLTDYRFRRLYSFHSWNPQAVTELALRPDKISYNVSEEVTYLIPTTVSTVYLPLYLIETKKERDQPTSHYIAYPCTQNQYDTFFEVLVNSTPEILMPLRGEEQHNASHLWENWLKKVQANTEQETRPSSENKESVGEGDGGRRTEL